MALARDPGGHFRLNLRIAIAFVGFCLLGAAGLLYLSQSRPVPSQAASAPNAFRGHPVRTGLGGGAVLKNAGHSLHGSGFDRAYGNLPLAFELNEGQTDSRVKFLSRGPGYTLFLTSDEAVLALRGAKRARQDVGTREAKRPFAWRQLSQPDVTAPPRHLARRSPHFLNEARRRDSHGRLAPFGSLLPVSVAPAAPSAQEDYGEATLSQSVLRIRLMGSNPKAKLVGLDPLPGKTNYFIGNDPKKWRTNVPTYSKVKYENVFPGIDLVYYGNQGKLEYDLAVKRAGDMGTIRFAIEGAKQARVDIDGALVVATRLGEIRWAVPRVYELGDGAWPRGHPQTLSARYVVVRVPAGRSASAPKNPLYEVGLKIDSHDMSQPLLIDPVLIYSTYLGGGSNDIASGLAVDAGGDAYVVGSTASSDFPVADAAQPSYAGGICDLEYLTPCTDAFVTKLDPSGTNVIFSTYLGGADSDDGASSVAVDSLGNAYVTGTTGGNFPTTAGSFQPSGAHNIFLAKLGPDGSLIYSSLFGASNMTGSWSVAVDSSGDAFLTGNVGGADFPTTPGALQPNYGGGMNCVTCGDVFVLKMNPSGSAPVYSTYLGGSADEVGTSIAVDAAGNAIVVGTTNSVNFPLANAFQSTCDNCATGIRKAFVAKLNAAGSALLYSTYLGGRYDNTGLAGAIDSNGSAYVTGQTSSFDFPVLNPMSNCSVNTQGFLAKLKPDGTGLVYSTCLPDTGVLGGLDIAVDAANSAYVAGINWASATGESSLVPVKAIQTIGEACCAYLIKVDPTGSNISFATYWGGYTPVQSGFSVTLGAGVALDSSGNAYLYGPTQQDLPVTLGARQTSYAGGGDAYIAKIGRADAPGASFAPGNFSFGDQPVGSISDPQEVAFFNTGSVPLSISHIDVTGDFALAPITTCSGQIPAADHCLLDLRFEPATSGTLTGSVTIYDDAAGSPHVLAAYGTTIPSAAFGTLSAPYLNFPSTTAGYTSAPQTVTLTNTGSAPLHINGIEFTGAPFNETNDCPATLPVKAFCTFNVVFAPQGVGIASGAVNFVTIISDAPDSPTGFFLTGDSVQATTEAVVSPSVIDFGPQPLGTTSSPQPVSLSNPGTGTLTITGITTTGDFAIVKGGTSCSTASTLAPGTNCIVELTFTPTALNSRTGTLTFMDNPTSGEPTQSVHLVGSGTDFSIGLAQGSPSSATVSAGQSATFGLAIAPQAGFDQTVSLSCSGAPSKATCSVSPSSLTPDGTNPAAATVTVTTTARSLVPPVSSPNSRPLWPGGLRVVLWFVLLGVLLFLAATKRLRLQIALAAALLCVAASGGCGGGGGGGGYSPPPSNPGTPAGTYSLTITGSSGTLTHSTTVSLTVN